MVLPYLLKLDTAATCVLVFRYIGTLTLYKVLRIRYLCFPDFILTHIRHCARNRLDGFCRESLD